MHDYYYSSYGVPDHMFFGGFFMMCLVVLGVFALVWVIRGARYGRHGGCCGHGSNALEILKERYAKSEINKEEFEAKKKDLEA